MSLRTLAATYKASRNYSFQEIGYYLFIMASYDLSGMEGMKEYKFLIFMGCADARKGIFNTFLTLYDRHTFIYHQKALNLNLPRRSLKVGGVNPLYPLLAMPLHPLA